MNREYPLYLAGTPLSPNHDLPVTNKFSGEEVARVAKADRAMIEDAIAHAAEAAEAMRRMPVDARKAALLHCVRRFTERAEELAHVLCLEAGKPIQFARGEVGRLIDTFSVAAEETTRQTGEYLPLDIGPRTRGYWGMWRRVPIGLCSFITPWNFPLNLPAHKIAPAIAAGCPFVLKPASYTPIGALIIGETLAETNLPAGAFSILPCSSQDADPLIEDERIKLLSFTGSGEVGWELKRLAGKKKVALELGGNAACIIDEGTDVGDAVKRLVFGAFYQSGQSCISVQRIIVHESLYGEIRDELVDAAERLKMGDPLSEETFIGPIISEGDAERIEQCVKSAIESGARLLCGGQREGAMMAPTLLERVPRTHPLSNEEIFGPVALLSPFSDFDEALEDVNDSRYGLQAGVFTRDIDRIKKAWDRLEVGGVVINDVPSWRVDHMPYGGVKESGIGREGIRFAMEEMSEIRLLAVRETKG